MSDSELSSAANIPADSEIERCLERVTRALVKDETQDLTINLVRSRAEDELGLDKGFLKNTPEWKDRSKKLIQDTADEEENADKEEEPPEPAPKSTAKPKAKPAAKAGKKRPSDEEENGTKKRRKKATKVESEDDISEPELDDDDEESDVKPAKKQKKRTAKKPAKRRSSAKVVRDDEGEEQKPSVDKDEEEDDDEPQENKSTHTAPKDESELSDVPDKLEEDALKPNGKSAPADDDESDMSSLIDDPPPKKKRQKKTAASETKPKATAKGSKVTKSKSAGKETSPDEEEIKRLQGWLVKCGIRKRWHLELAKCSTPKEKIKHLKVMLDDAGMSGRYSNEKAKQIKEARELAEEIEAAQEFNERWGQSEGDDDDEEDSKKIRGDGKQENEESKADGPPKRRLPKGFVDFGDSGDDGSD